MIYRIWFLNKLLAFVPFIFALCVYKSPIPILCRHYVFYVDITQLHLNSTGICLTPWDCVRSELIDGCASFCSPSRSWCRVLAVWFKPFSQDWIYFRN